MQREGCGCVVIDVVGVSEEPLHEEFEFEEGEGVIILQVVIAGYLETCKAVSTVDPIVVIVKVSDEDLHIKHTKRTVKPPLKLYETLRSRAARLRKPGAGGKPSQKQQDIPNPS